MEEGELFRNIRRALDMDQESFGALFQKGQSWVTKLERGKNESAKQFLEILNVLVVEHGVNPYYLVYGEGEIFSKGEIQATEKTVDSDLSVEARLDRIEKKLGI